MLSLSLKFFFFPDLTPQLRHKAPSTDRYIMCKRMEIVDEVLRKVFRNLGRCIGNNPGYFIIVPILISALCASGFQRIVFEADPEYLFSPVDGQGKTERAILESHFPMNYTAFDPGR